MVTLKLPCCNVFEFLPHPLQLNRPMAFTGLQNFINQTNVYCCWGINDQLVVKEFLRKETVRHFVSDLVLSIMITDNNAFNLFNVSSNAVGGAITSSIKKEIKKIHLLQTEECKSPSQLNPSGHLSAWWEWSMEGLSKQLNKMINIGCYNK